MRSARLAGVRALAARVRGLLRGPQHDEGFDEEIQEHVRLLADRFVAQGMPRSEAECAARRQFGNITLLREDRRALETLPALEALWRDLRYALRALGRSPGFAAVSIVTLGLGIGAATAIYSVIQNVMLAPFPYRSAERIVFPRLYDQQQGPQRGRQGYSAAEVLEFVESSDVFEDTTAVLGQPVLYRHRTGTELLDGALVTPGTFEFFGLPALHGRVLQRADYEPGAPPAAVMSYKAWTDRFGGDLSILNTTLALNGTARTLVGIMPPRFGWYGADVFFPATLTGRSTTAREYWFLVGRLKPGVRKAQAEAELTTIAHRLAKMQLHPDGYPQHLGVYVGTLGESVIGPIRAPLYTVLAAVGLLLLIACGNVANLMLARATVREKEFALRAALGAGRTRIVGLLILESLVLAAGAAALGILLAAGGLKALVAALPPNVIPSESVIALNASVLGVTLGLAVMTALLCGLAPAVQSFRREVSDPLRDSGKGTTGGFRGRGLRDAVVGLEVALSLTLVIGAGLLMRSFVALRDLPLGVQADHVFTTALMLPEDRYVTTDRVRALVQPLVSRVKALPGVVHAAAATAMPPFSGGQTVVEVAGQPSDEVRQTTYQQVTEEYFDALRLRVETGRPFTAADITDARKVAIVNETFVRAYLAGARPLGRRVRLRDLGTAATPVRDAWFEIVGVVGDLTNRGPQVPAEPEVWIPSTIAVSPVQVLIVRTSHDPAALAAAVRHEVWRLDSGIPLLLTGRLEDFLAARLYAGSRFAFLVMMVFGSIALILVTVGVYSVLAYATTQKTHEIGIRMALGATTRDVLKMILRSGLRPVIAGVVAGLAISALVGRTLGTQLVGVTAYDPRTLAGAATLLVTVGVIACWIPARRAARTTPLVALRRE
jgi:predicted permease